MKRFVRNVLYKKIKALISGKITVKPVHSHLIPSALVLIHGASFSDLASSPPQQTLISYHLVVKQLHEDII